MHATQLFFADYLIWLYILFPFFPLLRRQNHLAAILFTSAGLSWFLTWLIKNLYYLPRPFVLNGQLPLIPVLLDGSFPSSHTALAFGISLAMWPYQRKLSLLLIVGGLLIGSSRIVVGVHSYFDILGGALIALVCVLLVRTIDTYHSG